MDYGEVKYIFKKEGFTPSDEDKKLKCPIATKTPERIRWFSVSYYNF